MRMIPLYWVTAKTTCLNNESKTPGTGWV